MMTYYYHVTQIFLYILYYQLFLNQGTILTIDNKIYIQHLLCLACFVMSAGLILSNYLYFLDAMDDLAIYA